VTAPSDKWDGKNRRGDLGRRSSGDRRGSKGATTLSPPAPLVTNTHSNNISYGIENSAAALLDELTDDYGLSRQSASELIRDVRKRQIHEALRAVDEYVTKQGADKIKNIAGLTEKAVRSGWRHVESKFARKERDSKNEETMRAQALLIRKQLAKEFEHYRWEVVRDMLNELPSENREELNALCLEKMPTPLRTIYTTKGADNPIIQASYRTFMVSHFENELPPEARGVEEFIRARAPKQYLPFFASPDKAPP